MPRAALAPLLAALLGASACSGAVVAAPVTRVVTLPAPDDDSLVADPDPSHPVAACPPDTVAEKDHCVRVVASPEIQAWAPPPGHLDPCATWTSDKGMVDCDPKNEDPPVDAGKAHR
jgi:hypothetical protein